jgi:nucleotide-binding universal stress UspA family protein
MRAIQRILCAVDLSGASADAAAQAIALARWCHGRISALYVCEPVFAPVPSLPPPNERIGDQERALARECVAAYFASAADIDVPVDVLIDTGPPATCILDRADALSADVIVMATHGASGFQHLLLGSVTEKVLRRARCGVLTVPPLARSPSPQPFTRILCPVDFSDPSLFALEAAASLARASSAGLTLVHVVEWPWHEPPAPSADDVPQPQAAALAEFRRYIEASATRRLEKLGADLALDSAPVLSIVHGKPYVEILRVAADSGADLIVMGVHGRNVVDMTLFGSTTNQLVRQAACPVLTFRQ